MEASPDVCAVIFCYLVRSMYPFDQYWFGVDIAVYANVVSLTNASLSYQVAVPLYYTFLENTPAFK